MRRIFSILLVGALLAAGAGCASGGKRSNPAEAHYMLGLSYLQEQDPTRALKEFLRAADLDPRNAEIQAALAQSYYLKKAYPEAERHYLRALKLSDGDPQIQNNLAALYLDMERWDDAIRYFRKASDNLLFTNQTLALTGLGYAHARKGEHLEAVTAYQKALQQNPRSVQAHLLLGESYDALGRTAPAVGAFLQALALSPGHARAHFQLGLTYMKAGEKEKAAASFREVLRLAPATEQGAQAAEYLKLISQADTVTTP